MKAVVTWGTATGLAFLLCGQLNITLLQAVRADRSGEPPFWADLLITALVVGAGRTPLHDLISNIEQRKEEKKEPPCRRWLLWPLPSCTCVQLREILSVDVGFAPRSR